MREEKDYREHRVYRDHVLEEHERSSSNARSASLRAQSANESVREALQGATSVIETYKKAEEDFKLSMQQHMNNLLSEESEKINQQKITSVPRYMSWRPKNYSEVKPRRQVDSSFIQAAIAAKRREGMQQIFKRKQITPIKSKNGSSYALTMNCATEDTRSSLFSQSLMSPSDSVHSGSGSRWGRDSILSARSNHIEFHPSENVKMFSDKKFLALPVLNKQIVSANGNSHRKN